MDSALFHAVNHGMQNRFFDWLMPVATEYKNWIVVGIVLAVYLIRTNPKKGMIIILVAVVAFTLGDFINHRVLKELFGRVRPCNALPDVHLLVGCGKSLSFPSSHSINSFTIAAVFGFYDKRLLPFTIFAASLIAFSRVYLGVHYVSDVIVGGFIGAGLGYLAYRISNKLSTGNLEEPKQK